MFARLRWVLMLSFATLSTACSGGNGDPGANVYGALFDAPRNPTRTPDSLFGLWGGAVEDRQLDMTLDIRLRLSETKITIATRCHLPDGTTLTVGATSAVSVTDTEVTTLESDEGLAVAGDYRCSASTRPAKTRYSVRGTDLTLAADGRDLHLVKVSD